MSSHNVVIVATCILLEVVQTKKYWSITCGGSLINFSESEKPVNKPFNADHICIIYHLGIGEKGNSSIFFCTMQLYYSCQYQIIISSAKFIYIISPILPVPTDGMGTSWKKNSFFQKVFWFCLACWSRDLDSYGQEPCLRILHQNGFDVKYLNMGTS